jgi:SAM-dependent methyltransferase
MSSQHQFHRQTLIETNLVKERIPSWFNAFITHTDEKEKIANLIGNLITAWQKDGYLNNKIKILDLGCAGAELSTMIIERIKNHHQTVQFFCIENRESYVTKAREALNKVDIDNTIIQGNCFHYNFKNLAADFDLIIASHVAYYDNQSIPKLINSLLEVKTKDGFAIFIHESANSIPNQLRLRYHAPTSKETSKNVHFELKKYNCSHASGKLYSKVNFPFGNYHSELLEAENKRICISETQTELKYLSEFIIQRPLEILYEEGNLSDFILDLNNYIASNQYSLFIETDIEVVGPLSYGINKVKATLEDCI